MPLHRRHPAALPRTCRSSRACGSSATKRSWKRRSARREAERGTFDPTYLVYTRRQADAAEAAAGLQGSSRAKSFSLRTFHDTLLGNGTAPFWLHRQLMLGEHERRRAGIESGTTCLSTNIECDACGHRFEMIQKFSDPPLETCPKCGRARSRKLHLVAGDSVQGHRLVHHRLREEGSGDRRGQDGRRDERQTSDERQVEQRRSREEPTSASRDAKTRAAVVDVRDSRRRAHSPSDREARSSRPADVSARSARRDRGPCR